MSLWTVFDLVFDARPRSLFNFRVDIDIFRFGGIYMVLKLVPPDKDCCSDKSFKNVSV